ncbi:MAG: hypothetical protein IPO00_17215 [Betaproteobacteria bacterium]|nr:hypothetical protein [Betaproteobacteria bacterium]
MRLVFCNAPYVVWAGRPREQLIGGTLEGSSLVLKPGQQPNRHLNRAFQGESAAKRLLTHPPPRGAGPGYRYFGHGRRRLGLLRIYHC